MYLVSENKFIFKKEILMIPERTHEALINGGIGHIGSANADLKTTHTETFGASLDNENNCVTCFVLSILAEPILENLKEKGRISFFFGLPSHEAYQFKGQFLETREITEEELANTEKVLSVTKDMFDSIGIKWLLDEKNNNNLILSLSKKDQIFMGITT